MDKEYLRALPSVNASYSVRENLIARAAYYHSLGRPDFNQYAGGLTLPDTELPPGPTNRITVNNAAIKAWSARSTKVSLEYYFQGVGMVSIGGYRRNFENFFGGTVLSPTPEFLAVYGLDESFLEYDVSTQYNLDTGVRMEGLEVSYQQALTFLPVWARGISVFANANSQRALGSATANFNGFLPRKANWGLSLSRPKYSLNLNFSYRGKSRVAQLTGATIEPGTFNWIPPVTRVDFTAEYRLPRGFSVFLNVRDLTNSRDIVEVYGPSTPEYARLNTYTRNQGLWTLGIRGTF